MDSDCAVRKDDGVVTSVRAHDSNEEDDKRTASEYVSDLIAPEAYLEQHRVAEVLNRCIRDMLRDRPHDAIKYMTTYMMKQCSSTVEDSPKGSDASATKAGGTPHDEAAAGDSAPQQTNPASSGTCTLPSPATTRHLTSSTPTVDVEVRSRYDDGIIFARIGYTPPGALYHAQQSQRGRDAASSSIEASSPLNGSSRKEATSSGAMTSGYSSRSGASSSVVAEFLQGVRSLCVSRHGTASDGGAPAFAVESRLVDMVCSELLRLLQLRDPRGWYNAMESISALSLFAFTMPSTVVSLSRGVAAEGPVASTGAENKNLDTLFDARVFAPTYFFEHGGSGPAVVWYSSLPDRRVLQPSVCLRVEKCYRSNANPLCAMHPPNSSSASSSATTTMGNAQMWTQARFRATALISELRRWYAVLPADCRIFLHFDATSQHVVDVSEAREVRQAIAMVEEAYRCVVVLWEAVSSGYAKSRGEIDPSQQQQQGGVRTALKLEAFFGKEAVSLMTQSSSCASESNTAAGSHISDVVIYLRNRYADGGLRDVVADVAELLERLITVEYVAAFGVAAFGDEEVIKSSSSPLTILVCFTERRVLCACVEHETGFHDVRRSSRDDYHVITAFAPVTSHQQTNAPLGSDSASLRPKRMNRVHQLPQPHRSSVATELLDSTTSETVHFGDTTSAANMSSGYGVDLRSRLQRLCYALHHQRDNRNQRADGHPHHAFPLESASQECNLLRCVEDTIRFRPTVREVMTAAEAASATAAFLQQTSNRSPGDGAQQTLSPPVEPAFGLGSLTEYPAPSLEMTHAVGTDGTNCRMYKLLTNKAKIKSGAFSTVGRVVSFGVPVLCTQYLPPLLWALEEEGEAAGDRAHPLLLEIIATTCCWIGSDGAFPRCCEGILGRATYFVVDSVRVGSVVEPLPESQTFGHGTSRFSLPWSTIVTLREVDETAALQQSLMYMMRRSPSEIASCMAWRLVHGARVLFFDAPQPLTSVELMIRFGMGAGSSGGNGSGVVMHDAAQRLSEFLEEYQLHAPQDTMTRLTSAALELAHHGSPRRHVTRTQQRMGDGDISSRPEEYRNEDAESDDVVVSFVSSDRPSTSSGLYCTLVVSLITLRGTFTRRHCSQASGGSVIDERFCSVRVAEVYRPGVVNNRDVRFLCALLRLQPPTTRVSLRAHPDISSECLSDVMALVGQSPHLMSVDLSKTSIPQPWIDALSALCSAKRDFNGVVRLSDADQWAKDCGRQIRSRESVLMRECVAPRQTQLPLGVGASSTTTHSRVAVDSVPSLAPQQQGVRDGVEEGDEGLTNTTKTALSFNHGAQTSVLDVGAAAATKAYLALSLALTRTASSIRSLEISQCGPTGPAVLSACNWWHFLESICVSSVTMEEEDEVTEKEEVMGTDDVSSHRSASLVYSWSDLKYAKSLRRVSLESIDPLPRSVVAALIHLLPVVPVTSSQQRRAASVVYGLLPVNHSVTGQARPQTTALFGSLERIVLDDCSLDSDATVTLLSEALEAPSPFHSVVMRNCDVAGTVQAEHVSLSKHVVDGDDHNEVQESTDTIHISFDDALLRLMERLQEDGSATTAPSLVSRGEWSGAAVETAFAGKITFDGCAGVGSIFQQKR